MFAVYDEGRRKAMFIQEEDALEYVLALRAKSKTPHHYTMGNVVPYYTIPQAAEELQVHENTIYKMVRAGKLEHYKIGHQIRIALTELEKLKVERKSKSELDT